MILEPVDNTAMKQMSSIHNLEIKDTKELHSSYLWFAKNGGLFLKYSTSITFQNIEPGQDVYVIFKMLDNPTKIPINGKVVFFNKNGFGIEFPEGDQFKMLKSSIEREIMHHSIKKENTHTI